MRMEKLTNQLQSALSEAQSIAIGNDHTAIEPEHLLLALLDQQGGSVRPILNRAGFDVSGLQHQIHLVATVPKIFTRPQFPIIFDQSVEKTFKSNAFASDI